ncbi:methyltransferase [Enterococcus florum]|uniref:Methyltransferase n=1 Tax=Enterococcus florum TaxID=2480627 RepID=A0A4P5PI52_9ENTE|nr:class I SAM-dependent methyltransferase [Enterococcus florum]GCF95332.1 methyltransferase [Enterococcus florum]
MNNVYDNEDFFEKYSQMSRSKQGLEGAGEWRTLEKLLPDFNGKRVLDLGCGYGWHCIYAAEHGAKSVVGVDISSRMLEVAREKTPFESVTYVQGSIDALDFPADQFDIVLSSLAFHYLPSFEKIAQQVHAYLSEGGRFVFSVEHPIFTANGNQDWVYDEKGEIQYFPVDRYFYEGERSAHFLGSEVTKYHKTLTTYLDGLLTNGFRIDRLVEPMPPEDMWSIPGMKDEMRRPMMLIVSATNLKSPLV